LIERKGGVEITAGDVHRIENRGSPKGQVAPTAPFLWRQGFGKKGTRRGEKFSAWRKISKHDENPCNRSGRREFEGGGNGREYRGSFTERNGQSLEIVGVRRG